MAQFSVKKNNIDSAISAEGKLANELSSIQSEIRGIGNSLGFELAAKANIQNRLNSAANSVFAHRTVMNHMRSALQDTVNAYERTENTILGNLNVGDVQIQNVSGETNKDSGSKAEDTDHKKKNDLDWLWKGVGIFGPAGKIVGGLGRIVTGDKGTTTTWAKAAKDVGKGALGLVKATKEAGTKADWMKEVFGLKVKPIEIGVKVKGSNAIFSAITSAADNYEEYKTGAVSAKRALAEWVTETALDVGKDALIAAGVAAAFTAIGITSAPAVVVGAATVAVSVGADWVCKKVTGKKLTEAVSDFVLDTAESGWEMAKTGAKKVSEGASALWSNVKQGWSSVTSGKWKFGFA